MKREYDEVERSPLDLLHSPQSAPSQRLAVGALQNQSESLRVTLASIGDAVISTDADDCVTYLNEVAEQLTGWSFEHAVGRSLTQVFRVVHEQTRQPLASLGHRALVEGVVLGVANHMLLLARDGRERPIEARAAPIRDGSGPEIGAVVVFRDVSERRRGEEARARLAAIVASSDDAIISKSLDGTILTWNAGAERIFGYTADEAIGQSITLIIPRERHEEERQILARLSSGERVDHFETVRVTRTGQHIDISLTISPLRDDQGRIIGASKVARDITDRKRAEAILRNSEGRLRFLAELAAATQSLTAPSEIMSAAARLLAEHLGVDRCAYAEIEDESIFVITGDHPINVPSVVGRWAVGDFGVACQQHMLNNQPFVVIDAENDPRLTPRDLEAYHATNIRAVICVPLHKAGKFTAAMAVHQTTPRSFTADDIQLVRTVADRCWESLERARVTRTLRDSEARYRAIVEATPDCVSLIDTRGILLQMNPAGAAMFEAEDVGSLLGRPIFELIAPEYRVSYHDFHERVCHGEHGTLRFEIIGLAGTRRHMETAAVPLPGPRGEFTHLAVTRDITERRQLEDSLRAADRKKDMFIALLAHELRNPLAPIRNGLQIMQLAGRDTRASERALRMMDRQLSHMVRLIDDLLDVSRINRNKMDLRRARVLLSDVLNSALETARPMVEAERHVMHVSLPSEPVYLDADLTRLAQVFSNLLSNSAKYTEAGGQIWLTAERRSGEVKVSVRDTGIGIPTDSLATVFDMFAQLDRPIERTTGGLGIGLALVKGLVEMHGGTVKAESSGAGRGSTFTVTLPSLPDLVKPPEAASQRSLPGGTRPHRRILVVDDNRDGADSLSMMLRLLNNDVQIAHDGLEAIDRVESFRPHLIFMDLGMPRLNGYEATRRIRALPIGPGIKIIALSGWGQEGDRIRSQEAGCDGHLVKPLNVADLQKLLSEVPGDKPA